MSDPVKAVFLSYASQDAEAAKRICEALRAAGAEVWFDQSELVGGDAWDAKIRKQIKECALLIPVISAATQARTEGYFRLEWRLADQRTHLMAKGRPFLLPVVIDDTRDAGAHVPDSFTEVQWTRLPAGETPPAFAARVKKLLEGEVGASLDDARGRRQAAPLQRSHGPSKWWWLAPIFGVTMALLLIMKESRPDAPAKAGNPPAAPALSQARQLAGRALQFRSLNGLTRERLGAAEDLLEQGLKIDPLEPEVWAVGAQVDVLMVYRGWDNSDVRRQSAAKRVARALALAPDGFESRHAQAVLAAFLVQTPEAFAEAETAYRALLREQPENRDLLEELGTCLRRLGHYDEASGVFQRAGRPVLVGWASYSARRFEETRRIADGLLAEKRTAEALILKASVELFGFNDRAAAQAAINRLTPTELREDDAAGIALRLAVLSSDAPGILKLLEPFPHPFVSIDGVDYPRQYWTGIARMLQRQPEAAEIEWHGALQALEERLKAKPDDEFTLGWAGLLHARLGDRAGTERALRLYGNYADLTDGQWDWNYCLALLCLGDRNDEVIARLEKTMRDPNLRFNYVLYAWARFSPEFEPMRGQPRFEKLLRDALPKDAKPFDDPKLAAEAVKIDDKSVAVLAFANLSDDKANEYFSDGISEELLNVLAKVPQLKVAARTSSFYFKGRDEPIPEMARKLGVAYVVEGSVRKAGNKVRITAQLIKAADGFHVWSDTYDRDLTDIFAVQDEIAKNILGVVKGSLLGGRELPAAAATKPEAYALFLEAQGQLARRGEAPMFEAERLFKAALAIDPDYVPALVGLARTQYLLPSYGSISGPKALALTVEARQAAEHALKLEPGNAGALTVHGSLLSMSEWRWAEGEAELLRARELAPNDPWVANLTGDYFMFTANVPATLAAKRKWRELDPLSATSHWDLGYACLLARDYDQAIQCGERARQLSPNDLNAATVIALAAGRAGRFDLMHQALATGRRDVHENEGLHLLLEADCAILEKHPAEARRFLAQAELLAGKGEASPAYIGYLHLLLGESDPARTWLQQAYDLRDVALTWAMNIDFADIAADPKTRPLLDLPGLKELWEIRQRNARAGTNKP